MPSDVEIGVWVDGAQKWVTGVTRRTSCHDIIKALLRAQNLPAADCDVNKYVIIERWRKVERPLDHEQRILKVWKTWGEAVQEVRFSLRQMRSDEEKSDSDRGSRIERSRRRHKLRHSHYSSTATGRMTMKDDPRVSETMERLMRLVVAQGETIQAQLRRMHERDQQIEAFEHQMHLLRVQSLGSDYLLHSYLRDPPQDESSSPHQEANSVVKDDITCEEKSNDSGVVTEEVSAESVPDAHFHLQKGRSNKTTDDTIDDVKAKAYLMDKLEAVLNRLLEHEEILSHLESSLAETAYNELSELKVELETASSIHATTVSVARQNEQQLRELDTILYQRRLQLESLIEEDAKYEKEALALQAHLNYIIHLPPTAFQLPPEKDQSISSLYGKDNQTPCSKSTCFSTTSTLPTTSPASSVPTQEETKKAGDSLDNGAINSNNNITESKEISSIKSVNVSNRPTDTTTPKGESPPPLPTTSPPHIEEDDQDSGKISSLCVSSSSSTSSETSRRDKSPCQGSSKTKVTTNVAKGDHSPRDNESTDSNSDTGLSSLHSSSDEGAYVLDTLV